MRLHVELSQSELHGILLTQFDLNPHLMEVGSVYLQADGGIEFVVREKELVPEPMEMKPPELWCPAPPFIHTTEVGPPPTRKCGWYPEDMVEHATISKAQLCNCNSVMVYPEIGWIDENDRLHQHNQCEPPTISAAAALSASFTSESGTIDSDDNIPF